MDLPVELRGPKKGLINVKNKDKKCFLWCQVRHGVLMVSFKRTSRNNFKK